MNRTNQAMIVFAGLVAVWLLIRATTDGTRYDGGHPGVVDAGIFAVVVLVSLTHAALGAILWLQRAGWHPADEAAFLFVSVKALFWGDVAVDYEWAGKGIDAERSFFLLAILGTSAYFDARLVRRYVVTPGDVDRRRDVALERTADAAERTATATEKIAEDAVIDERPGRPAGGR